MRGYYSSDSTTPENATDRAVLLFFLENHQNDLLSCLQNSNEELQRCTMDLILQIAKTTGNEIINHKRAVFSWLADPQVCQQLFAGRDVLTRKGLIEAVFCIVKSTEPELTEVRNSVGNWLKEKGLTAFRDDSNPDVKAFAIKQAGLWLKEKSVNESIRQALRPTLISWLIEAAISYESQQNTVQVAIWDAMNDAKGQSNNEQISDFLQKHPKAPKGVLDYSQTGIDEIQLLLPRPREASSTFEMWEDSIKPVLNDMIKNEQPGVPEFVDGYIRQLRSLLQNLPTEPVQKEQIAGKQDLVTWLGREDVQNRGLTPPPQPPPQRSTPAA